jgi:hypothetical protein
MAITIDGADNKLEIGANATGPSSLRLYEDTDNGTNYVSIIAPSTLTSDRILTLPDSTGTLINTAPGTAGNVLTSNGTAWASSAPTSGSFVYLASATANNSVVDFTALDTTTYFAFLITFTDVRTTAFSARLYLNGTLNSSNIYYYVGTSNDGSTETAITGSGSSFTYLTNTATATANLGCSGYLYLFSAGGYSNFCGQLTSILTTTSMQRVEYASYLNSSTAANGIRFGGLNVGNLTGGDFRLYGIKAS